MKNDDDQDRSEEYLLPKDEVTKCTQDERKLQDEPRLWKFLDFSHNDR
jgi:hypothetical protein